MDTTQVSIWKDFFGVSNDTAFQTIVPTLIALLIFFLGLLFERLKNYLTNRRKSSQIRDFIISQIKVLLLANDEQKKNIQKYLNDLRIEQIFNLSFELKVGFNSQHIKSILSPDLFRILVLEFFRKKDERLKVFNILLEQMDLVDGLRSEFASSFEYARKHFSDYENQWNENLVRICDTHDTWATKLGTDLILNDPFLRKFFQIYNLWAKNEKYTDMYIAEKALINPTLEIAKETQPNDYGLELLRPLLGGQSAIDNHRNLRKSKMDEFNLYLIQINGITEKLNSFLKLNEPK